MTADSSQRSGWWRGLGALVLAFSGISSACAQVEGFGDLLELKPKAGRVPKPEFKTTLSPATAQPGDEVTLTVDVTLPKGYYIYGADGKSGIRTQIKTREAGLEAVDTDFVPDRAPKVVFEPLFQEEVSKFYDHVTWKKRYRIAKDADPKQVQLHGELTGQYCSEGTDTPGQCVPIIPAYEFRVALGSGDVPPPVVTPPEVRFAYEERPIRGKTNPALLRFNLSGENAKPGEKVTLTITMELDAGWHTFALTHKGEGGVATEIILGRLSGLKPLGDNFVPDHAPEIERPDGDLVLEVHHNRVTWTRELEVLPGTKPGQYGVSGTITYQTCKTSCLPAREVSFSLGHLTAAPMSVGSSGSNEPRAAAPPPGVPTTRTEGSIVPMKRPQDQGLFVFLLTALGFGWVSLLTPCVFPMVPITVSFFLKQSESQHHRPLWMALVFCGTIVATFTVLGLGIAAIFGAAKVNALANNTWLNAAIGLVFVAFAFNMLGLFEIRIPSELLTFTSNKEAAGGYLGAVFMALTFTLTSFTCTFAFAGSLLVAASQGQYYWPIIGMIAFGAAFASPFFVLAMVPSMLKKLPKSGGWMNSVKVVMGLIEIGAAVKFFSVADLGWNSMPMLFDFVSVMVAWLVLSLAIGLYLLGIFRLAHDTPLNGLSVGRLTLALAFLGLAGMLGVGVIAPERGGGWLMDQIIAFAPPRFEPHEETGIASDLPQPTISHHGIRFSLDVDKAIAFASPKQQPLLFDFTGVNCVNCRLMEKKLAQPQNRNRLEKFVLVQLYADKVPTIADDVEAKRLLARNVKLQESWFGDVTLPSYAVVTPDGKTILSNYFGLEQKDGEFAAFLDDGWKKWQATRTQAADRGVSTVDR